MIEIDSMLGISVPHKESNDNLFIVNKGSNIDLHYWHHATEIHLHYIHCYKVRWLAGNSWKMECIYIYIYIHMYFIVFPSTTCYGLVPHVHRNGRRVGPGGRPFPVFPVDQAKRKATTLPARSRSPSLDEVEWCCSVVKQKKRLGE